MERLCRSRGRRPGALLVLAGLLVLSAHSAVAGPTERVQAKRMHDRLVGVPPAEAVLSSMEASLVANDPIAAAYTAMNEHLKAAQAWEHCVKTDPMNPRVWLWQVHAGDSLLKAGEREQAYLWLQQAKLAAPNASEVKALEAAIAAAHD